MFKEAALMHVALFERLAAHGLTLKDWHPLNILYSGTRPVFVDFTSIIPVESLPSQAHLKSARPPKWFGDMWDDTSKAVYEMYRLMYDPYFGLPLTMMDRGHHARARQRIYETTLNTGDDYITRREVFNDSLLARIVYELEDRMLRLALRQKGGSKTAFFRRVRHSIARRKAALRGSAYSSYYEDKNEAFSSEPSEAWTNKQHGVHKALTMMRPATVLDLGSNAGRKARELSGCGGPRRGFDRPLVRGGSARAYGHSSIGRESRSAASSSRGKDIRGRAFAVADR
jgi:hypothetical protein